MGTPALYGIKNSNRNYSDPYYWGKNQFNSSFPIALSCYMRDRKIPAVYISTDKAGKTRISEQSFDFIFGTKSKTENLRFDFESHFESFQKMVEDDVEKIDVVISENTSREQRRALEVKLTTLPDNSTCMRAEEFYGAEIVVRSATMRYMALNMAYACGNALREDIKNIFSPACRTVRNWESKDAMNTRKNEIFHALEIFLKKYYRKQQPLILQPIWKTEGKSAKLAENCLDIFVWSDFAVARLFMESLTENAEAGKISRQERAALRLSRFLYEWATIGKVFQAPIYDGMTYDYQNDKNLQLVV